MELDLDRLPKHVAIIMDGNGRWAKKRGIARALGHRKGMETLRGIVRETSDLGIFALSLFAFSTENWKRSAAEVGFLMDLLLEFFEKEIDELHRNRVRIRIIGDLSGLPEKQRNVCLKAQVKTGENEGLRLNIALNYGGRDEIVRATRKLAAQVAEGTLAVDDIDASVFCRALDTEGMPDVDMMIRPSGEQRLSNFLLFQSAYAEFFFPSVLWPEFTVPIYHAQLHEFANRNRRYGGRLDKEDAHG